MGKIAYILIKRDKDIWWAELRLALPKSESDFDHFAKFETETGNKIGKIYNSAGGYQYLLKRDKILDTVIKDENEDFDFDELDFKKTSRYKEILKGTKLKKNKYGYIDREGRFWRCAYEDHEALAFYIFNSTTQDLEAKGYIHIYAGCEFDSANAHCETRITPEQYETLKSLKYIPNYVKEIQADNIMLS